jgi:predicted NUDIX family phosphoesterase
MGVYKLNRSLAQNAYLAVAQRAIAVARRPLKPREMLAIAETEGFLPAHLHGKTMYKTMSARLSEHIREASGSSAFYRTGPSTFFTHELADDPALPDEFKQVFVGAMRSKAVRRENVLVAPKDIVNSEIFGEFIRFDQQHFDDLYRDHCIFVDRISAEKSESYKQFVTFTIVVHSDKILMYRRGKYTTSSDMLKGQLSVGFGGHVNDTDFSLFDHGEQAFKHNAVRELREELFFDDLYKNPIDTFLRTEILGYINVDDSPDAKKHIAVLTAFHHENSELPRKGELSINQLAWYNCSARHNDLSEFDLWSEIIIRNIQSGYISIHSR